MPDVFCLLMRITPRLDEPLDEPVTDCVEGIANDQYANDDNAGKGDQQSGFDDLFQ